MSNAVNTFINIGKQYQSAFDEAHIDSMPVGKMEAYQSWTNEHPNYKPAFSRRLGSALIWVEQNQDEFDEVLGDFDASVEYVNEVEVDDVDAGLFVNIGDLKIAQPDTELPNIFDGTICREDPEILNRTLIDAAHRLRWGETIQPQDGDWYSWHNFVVSDRGMVVASLLDLYEIFTKTSGHYPTNSQRDAVVAGAITEAAYITGSSSTLFQALSDTSDQWIEGYDGFTPSFQELARNS